MASAMSSVRMRPAARTTRVSAVVDHLSILSYLAECPCLGENSRHLARAAAVAGGVGARARCRPHRQPVCENDRGGSPDGDDRAKKLNGRKRHLLVDTTGLLLTPIKGPFPRLKKVRVDTEYTGTGRDWIADEMGREVESIKHPSRPR